MSWLAHLPTWAQHGYPDPAKGPRYRPTPYKLLTLRHELTVLKADVRNLRAQVDVLTARDNHARAVEHRARTTKPEETP